MKITKIEKVNEPFKMDNGGQIFSVNAEIDGSEQAKVRTFTDKIKIEVGTDLTNAKREEKDYKGKKYIQYTLYAEKKEWSGGNAGGYKSYKTPYTFDELRKLFDECVCHVIARKELFPDVKEYTGLISTLFISARDCGIKIVDEKPEEKKDEEEFVAF